MMAVEATWTRRADLPVPAITNRMGCHTAAVRCPASGAHRGGQAFIDQFPPQTGAVNSEVSMEHICLSSEEQEQAPEPLQERRVDGEFHQVGRLRRGEAHFTLFNTHYIEVHSQGLGQKSRTYQFDLTFLDPRPRRLRRISWPSAASGTLLLGMAIWLGLVQPIQQSAGVLALLLAGSAISTGLFFLRSHDRIVFYSRHGRIPLISLLNRNPDSAQLKAFVHDLRQRVKRGRAGWSDKTQFLSAELKEHRRLRDEGGLTSSEYEAVKRRVLRSHT
jgi:hypothetical protein